MSAIEKLAERIRFEMGSDDTAYALDAAKAILSALHLTEAQAAALMDGSAVVVPLSDLRRLYEAAESDDTIIWCEQCGAWMDLDDPACATTVSDYVGCWEVATDREAERGLCRKHRALPAASQHEETKG